MEYCKFLEDYRLFSQGNETPELMHLWCGLLTLAGAAEKRIWLDQEYFNLYLNLYILLIALAALFLIPVYGMVITSFRSIDGIMQHGVWSVPRDVSLQAFSKAWSDAGLHRTIPNTFIITIPAVFGSIFVSALGAYALARLRFRGSFFLFVFLIAGLFFPPQVALFPLFKLFSNLTLYDTYLAQILTHIAWGIPVCTMVLRNFFSSIPYSIQEQARIDGCSHVRIFFQIILPLSKSTSSLLVGLLVL